MTLVRAAVLTAQQVGVDRDGSVTKIQIKDFIRKSEKIPCRGRRPGWEQITGHETPIDQNVHLQLRHLDTHFCAHSKLSYVCLGPQN